MQNVSGLNLIPNFVVNYMNQRRKKMNQQTQNLSKVNFFPNSKNIVVASDTDKITIYKRVGKKFVKVEKERSKTNEPTNTNITG